MKEKETSLLQILPFSSSAKLLLRAEDGIGVTEGARPFYLPIWLVGLLRKAVHILGGETEDTENTMDGVSQRRLVETEVNRVETACVMQEY